jgi:hypothetical protein
MYNEIQEKYHTEAQQKEFVEALLAVQFFNGLWRAI